MAPREVLIDTDISVSIPGAEIDDAAALLGIVGSPDINIHAITTVYGNATVETATENALRLVQLLDVDVPVTAGADRPLLPTTVFTPAWETQHQLRGGNPSEAGAKAILDAVDQHPGLDIVALGPLTNLALAARIDPDVIQSTGRIYAMGGNAGSGGEFNFDADRTAVDEVVASGWPITLFGLDITNKATFTPNWFENLVGGPAVEVLRSAAPAWIRQVEERGWHSGGCALHDALPAIYLSHPDVASIRPASNEELVSRGLSTNGSPNVSVAVSVDSTKFIQLVKEAVEASTAPG